jgi:hypothetical protein
MRTVFAGKDPYEYICEHCGLISDTKIFSKITCKEVTDWVKSHTWEGIGIDSTLYLDINIDGISVSNGTIFRKRCMKCNATYSEVQVFNGSELVLHAPKVYPIDVKKGSCKKRVMQRVLG